MLRGNPDAVLGVVRALALELDLVIVGNPIVESSHGESALRMSAAIVVRILEVLNDYEANKPQIIPRQGPRVQIRPENPVG